MFVFWPTNVAKLWWSSGATNNLVKGSSKLVNAVNTDYSVALITTGAARRNRGEALSNHAYIGGYYLWDGRYSWYGLFYAFVDKNEIVTYIDMSSVTSSLSNTSYTPAVGKTDSYIFLVGGTTTGSRYSCLDYVYAINDNLVTSTIKLSSYTNGVADSGCFGFSDRCMCLYGSETDNRHDTTDSTDTKFMLWNNLTYSDISGDGWGSMFWYDSFWTNGALYNDYAWLSTGTQYSTNKLNKIEYQQITKDCVAGTTIDLPETNYTKPFPSTGTTVMVDYSEYYYQGGYITKNGTYSDLDKIVSSPTYDYVPVYLDNFAYIPVTTPVNGETGSGLLIYDSNLVTTVKTENYQYYAALHNNQYGIPTTFNGKIYYLSLVNSNGVTNIYLNSYVSE